MSFRGRNFVFASIYQGFLGGSVVGKESACNPGDSGVIPGSGSKGMATHSSILAWEIPWTEEPGGLWSMGSQSAGHDSAWA